MRPSAPRLGYCWRAPLALAALLAAGCAATGAEQALRERTVVVLIESAPESLDPRLTLSANAQRLASLIAPGLVRIDDDGRPVADLAESFAPLGESGYRFVLRPGLTFHDGSRLGAADVVATYRSLRDPGLASPLGPKYRHLVAVEARDDRTVDFTLDRPFAPQLFDLKLGILPERAADPAWREAHRDRPIGAGPFRFLARRDEEHVLLEAFPGWYGGQPGIDRLEFVVVRDETTRVLSLLNGDADLAINAVSPVLVPRLERAPRLGVAREAGAGYAYLAFNLARPPLDDVRVRRAFALAIDREALARHKFRGAAALATGMLPERHWAYAPAPELAHDPDRARALLDEAGLPDPDGDGPGLRFTVTYKTSTDRFRKAIALVIAAQLEAVGIGVKLRAHEWGTFYGDVQAGRFEVITLKWTPVIEPHLLHWVFHSQSIPSEANGWTGGNRGGYRNAEVDMLLDRAAAEPDPERRRGSYARVQEVLGEELPYVPLWHEDTVAIVSRRLEGFALSPFGYLHPLAEARLR